MAGQIGNAYDLSLFESKKTHLVALKPNKKEEKSSRRHAKVQSLLNVSVYVLIALLVLAVIGFLITTNVQLTELNSRIAETKSRLSELESEQVRLESDLASKTSIANVNAYALENGMTVADAHQISYITVSGSDAVTVSADSTNRFAQIINAVKSFFS